MKIFCIIKCISLNFYKKTIENIYSQKLVFNDEGSSMMRGSFIFLFCFYIHLCLNYAIKQEIKICFSRRFLRFCEIIYYYFHPCPCSLFYSFITILHCFRPAHPPSPSLSFMHILILHSSLSLLYFLPCIHPSSSLSFCMVIYCSHPSSPLTFCMVI